MMFFAYLLASQPHGTLYVGMTDDLIRRVWEHKMKLVPGFTAKYGVGRLVWFEAHQTREAAWRREKQIKEWRRAWKIELTERDNPQWIDLYQASHRKPKRPESGWVGPGFRRDCGAGAAKAHSLQQRSGGSRRRPGRGS